MEASSESLEARDRLSNVQLRMKVEHFCLQHNAALVKFFTARLHCVQDARDVAQETYEWLLQHQDDPRVTQWLGAINPLVYRVAWNIAGNRLLKSRRHERLDRQMFNDGTSASVAPTPEQVCAAHEDLAIIQESLKELPPRCRMVFILARLEGLNFEEIAARMNISVRSVYRHVERALDYCLQRLNEAEKVAGRKRASRDSGKTADHAIEYPKL